MLLIEVVLLVINILNAKVSHKRKGKGNPVWLYKRGYMLVSIFSHSCMVHISLNIHSYYFHQLTLVIN